MGIKSRYIRIVITPPHADWSGKEFVWQSSSFLIGNGVAHPPPAFSSDPLVHVSATGGSTSLLGKDAGEVSNDIVEIDGPSSHPNFTKSASPSVRGILLVSSQILEFVFKVLSFSFNEQMCMVYIVLLILFCMSLVCIVMQHSLLLRQERVHSKWIGKILKFHTMPMMKMRIRRNTHEGVSIFPFSCVAFFGS